MNSSEISYSEKYDIFLSYRRDGGEAMAILLRDRLTAKGYNVFLDIENLNSGSFNTKLFDVIDNCKDFLLVCSINSLDRCVNDGDWVRMEINRALEKGKNIVPVMLRGFRFPDVLPDDIEAVRMQNGVNANSHEYFDAAIDRLADKFLTAKPTVSIPDMTERLHELINQNVVSKPKTKNIITVVSAVVIAALIVVVIFFNFFNGGEQIEITIYNNTSDTVQSIRFKRSDAEQWGENVVSKNPLSPGESIIVKFPLKEAELGIIWDMQNIFYLGDINRTFLLEGFTMYDLNHIVIYIDYKGDYAREFVRNTSP
jgi:hypothetical protein